MVRSSVSADRSQLYTRNEYVRVSHEQVFSYRRTEAQARVVAIEVTFAHRPIRNERSAKRNSPV